MLPGRSAISTGIAIELPYGYLADVRPRSGYSLKGFAGNDSARFVCDVLLGTIDSDYRGNINVIVRNNEMAFNVKAGQRIAQLLIHTYGDVEFEEVDELAPSMSAIVNVSPGLMMINGFTFHPLPSEAAADAALLMLSIDVPLLMSAFAPPPFAPL